MNSIRAFCLGLGGQRVDYAMRHHSRAYDAGWKTSCAVYLSAPFLAIAAASFVLGRCTA